MMLPGNKYYLSLVLALCLFPALVHSEKSDDLPLTSHKINPLTASEDTNKVNRLNALGRELMYQNPDTSIVLGNEAFALAEKLNWKKGCASSLSNLGVYYHIKSDFPRAL